MADITITDTTTIVGIDTEVVITTITDTGITTEDAIEHSLDATDTIEMPMTIDAMATEAVITVEAVPIDITEAIQIDIIEIVTTEAVIITETILLPHAIPEFQTGQDQVITAATRGVRYAAT